MSSTDSELSRREFMRKCRISSSSTSHRASVVFILLQGHYLGNHCRHILDHAYDIISPEHVCSPFRIRTHIYYNPAKSWPSSKSIVFGLILSHFMRQRHLVQYQNISPSLLCLQSIILDIKEPARIQYKYSICNPDHTIMQIEWLLKIHYPWNYYC